MTQDSGPARADSPVMVTVAQGETVYSIARRYNLSVRDLIEINRLSPPYLLMQGQVLRLPGGGDYIVQKGDTLLGLARRFKVDFNSLAATNNKVPPYPLRIGERLTLPGARPPVPPDEPAPAVAAAPPPSALPSSSGEGGSILIHSPNAAGGAGGTAPSSGGGHEVAAAPLPPPPAGAPSPAAGTAATAVSPPPSPSSPPSPTAMASAVPPVVPPPAAAAPAADPPPPRAGAGFLWPIRGEVVAEFGPLPGKGQHNDGINISAPKGAMVRAAESGVVVYVGNELKGFGNLLLIKHADGWMTAYAHVDQMKVRRGDKVRRGQSIATIGSTGNVAQPQLHFEIRRGTEAVNPLDYLRHKSAGLVAGDGNSFS